jgi:hypothetical protein
LAEAICRAVQHYPELSRPEEAGKLAALYGIEGTAQRIIQLLAKANIA